MEADHAAMIYLLTGILMIFSHETTTYAETSSVKIYQCTNIWTNKSCEEGRLSPPDRRKTPEETPPIEQDQRQKILQILRDLENMASRVHLSPWELGIAQDACTRPENNITECRQKIIAAQKALAGSIEKKRREEREYQRLSIERQKLSQRERKLRLDEAKMRRLK